VSTLRTCSWAVAVASGLQPTTFPVMIAAVSRNLYAFAGGIGPGQRGKPGTLSVEPVARLTELGEWQAFPVSRARQRL